MQCCGRCRHQYYCGQECQKRDWPQHRATCQRYAALQGTPNEIIKQAMINAFVERDFVTNHKRLRSVRGDVVLALQFIGTPQDAARLAGDRTLLDKHLSTAIEYAFVHTYATYVLCGPNGVMPAADQFIESAFHPSARYPYAHAAPLPPFSPNDLRVLFSGWTNKTGDASLQIVVAQGQRGK